jgi:murein DD-endopeptidase MepM/ murein hydrolase activator NlpD
MSYSKLALLTCVFVLLLTACSSFDQAPLVVTGSPVGAAITSPTPIKTQDSSTSLPLALSTPVSAAKTEVHVLPLSEIIPPTGEIEKVISTPQPTVYTFQICSPLTLHSLSELREITSDPYRPPPPGKEQRHHGIDFSYYRHGDRQTIQGVGVQSVLPGKVAASLVESYPYGNVVIIETPYSALPDEITDLLPINEEESIYTLYAHMDQPPLVTIGDDVISCQALGQVGKSGNAVEPHLHLEMRTGPPDATFTSMGYYQAQDTEEERKNYVRWRTGGEFLHFDPMLVLRDLADRLIGQ